MTNLVESEAYFTRRFNEAGMANASKVNLRTHRLTTLGKLASLPEGGNVELLFSVSPCNPV